MQCTQKKSSHAYKHASYIHAQAHFIAHTLAMDSDKGKKQHSFVVA